MTKQRETALEKYYKADKKYRKYKVTFPEFAPIPFTLIDASKKSEKGHSAAIPVYMELVRLAFENNRRRVRTSLRDLANVMDLSPITIKNGVDFLKKHGFIEVERVSPSRTFYYITTYREWYEKNATEEEAEANEEKAEANEEEKENEEY